MTFFSKIFPVSIPLPRLLVPEGKTRICVAGFGLSHHTGRARAIATAITEAYPDDYETWFYFDTRGFRPTFLDGIKSEIKESDSSSSFEYHKSSPFCWLETGGESTKQMTAIGGRDNLCEWTQAKFDASDSSNASLLALCEGEPSFFKEISFDNNTPGTAKTSLD